MCWNRTEVAKSILSETDAIDQLKDKDRRILFRHCIFMNRVDFMDILFDYDIVNRKMLTDLKQEIHYGKMLEQFYSSTPKTESPFYYLWNLHMADRQGFFRFCYI
jgi:ankyrin repeat protein